jgi:hypothetical protein
MHYGYSVKLARKNAEADASRIGVRLGQVCISNDIPVAVVAKKLRVSRQTVYGWFFGAVQPKAVSVEAIETFLASLD